MPDAFDWRPVDNDRVFSSQLSGSVQTVSLPGTRWGCTLSFGPQALNERPAVEAFLAKVRRQHRIGLWNLARPEPRGTISLSGVTLGASAAQFASQLTLAGCGSGGTLLAGDMIGLPGQLLMVAEDATADGSGAMTVILTHDLRAAHSLGAAVTLTRPAASFVQVNGVPAMPAVASHYPGFSVELIEVFA